MSFEEDNKALETIITLEGDDGSSYSCQVLDIFEYDNKEYALLLNMSGQGEGKAGQEAGSIIVMRFLQHDNQSMFKTIETEEEFNRVVAHVEEMVQEAQE